ncbi:MAG: hypothetical protein OEW42_20635, partial [Acidimicrobiia bacterium]|nr:hypothetical protein [Acidimicrobiia bacterium]
LIGVDAPIASATTDAAGAYVFNGIAAGDYLVVVTTPFGVPTIANNGSDALDSDVDALGVTGVLTITTGQVNTDVDAGVAGTGELSGTVVLDVDSLGALNIPADAPLEGIDVVLEWAGPDGVLGTSDDISFSATTDAAGIYTFAGVPSGPVRVTIVDTSLPDGVDNSFDGFDPIANGVTVTSMPLGGTLSGVDFGVAGTGTIAGSVRLDRDADGLFDNVGDTGLADVEVTATWTGPNGEIALYTTVTSIDGSFSFDDMPAGTFVVEVDPSGTTLAGFDPSYDPTVGIADLTNTVVIAAGGTNDTQHFGVLATGTLAGSVVLDVVPDPDAGLEGITVTATWPGLDLVGVGDDVVYSTVTDAAGGFSFADLPPGDYTVEVVTLPAGVVASVDPDGGVADGVSVVSVPVAGAAVDQVFVVAGTEMITGVVVFDVDGDGVLDVVGDYPLPSVPVSARWLGADGVLGGGDDVVFSTLTDGSGAYSFGRLPAGNVVVEIDTAPLVSSGLVDSTFDAVDGVADVVANGVVSVVLSAGGPVVTADFGLQGAGVITGSVDLDADPDAPLAGVVVESIWAGLDGSLGTLDDVAFSTVTNASGEYALANLPLGTYSVEVDPSDTTLAPAGMSPSIDPDGGTADGFTDAILLTSGAPTADVPFVYEGGSAIAGSVLLDVNGDATVPDATDVGIGGVDVRARWAGLDGLFGTADDAMFLTTTLPDGSYSFATVPAGAVRILVQSGSLPAGVDNS